MPVHNSLDEYQCGAVRHRSAAAAWDLEGARILPVVEHILKQIKFAACRQALEKAPPTTVARPRNPAFAKTALARVAACGRSNSVPVASSCVRRSPVSERQRHHSLKAPST